VGGGGVRVVAVWGTGVGEVGGVAEPPHAALITTARRTTVETARRKEAANIVTSMHREPDPLTGGEAPQIA
jgi:hypothetical protein